MTGFLPIFSWPTWEEQSREVSPDNSPSAWAVEMNARVIYTENLTAAILVAGDLPETDPGSLPEGAGLLTGAWRSAPITYVLAAGEMLGNQFLAGQDYDEPPITGQIGLRIGDLGNRNSSMRSHWFDILAKMNKLLNKAHQFEAQGIPGWMTARGELGEGPAKKTAFKDAGRAGGPFLENAYGPTPDLFVFSESEPLTFIPYSIVNRFVKLYNVIFGTNLSSTRSNKSILQVDREVAVNMIRNVAGALILLQGEIDRREDAARDAELAQNAAEAAMVGTDQEGFILEPLRTIEIETILEKPAYQKYFSTTFNQDVITFVPVIQNFFLTGKYFPSINQSFYASNALALEILISTIKNNDNYKDKPNLLSPPPTGGGAINDQLEQHSQQARDFILKMLLMTPINILKGLCELIDPHIGLTKMIKRITGYAFDEMAEVLNEPAEGMNEARREIIAETDPDAAENFRGINGDDLLTFVLCLLEASMQALGQIPPPEGLPPAPPNFFPDVKRDGINFTGKVSGLLMMPPTPLGLIYLLLGLIKDGDGTTDALAPNVDEDACADPAAETVDDTTAETVEDCEPGEIT